MDKDLKKLQSLHSRYESDKLSRKDEGDAIRALETFSVTKLDARTNAVSRLTTAQTRRRVAACM